MVAIKILFLFITIMGITVIHQVSATPDPVEICTSLLSVDFAYHVGNFDAQNNFKNSFQNLSLKQLEVKYGGHQRTGESIENFRIRELQKKLAEAYFLDLFTDHRLILFNRMKPIDWCQKKITMSLDLILEPRIKNCEGYIMQKLFGNVHINLNLNLEAENTNSEVPTTLDLSLGLTNTTVAVQENIFKMFYEQWSKADLQEYKTKFINDGLRMDDHKYFKLFSSYFFHYEEKVTMYVVDLMKGKFRSVGEYCEEEGHKAVTNSNFYKYNHLLQSEERIAN